MSQKVIAIECDLCDEVVDEWKGCVCGRVVCWDCVSWIKDNSEPAGGVWLCDTCKAMEKASEQRAETK